MPFKPALQRACVCSTKVSEACKQRRLNRRSTVGNDEVIRVDLDADDLVRIDDSAPDLE
jgi:hypothetical protein